MEFEKKQYKWCGSSQLFIHIMELSLLVLFAGLMNGLTLGYMSMNPVDLEVFIKSGLPKHRRFATKILSLIKRRHLLLCTLIISKSFATEAIPILLNQLLIPETATILISTALILIFTEIIPHSVCARFALVIGSAMAPAVHILVWICFPVSYPISKLLDIVLGRGRVALYRRAELKTLVNLHGNQGGKGGDLSCHEVSIIQGALEITEKTARDAMTLKSHIFSLDINSKLDRNMMSLIIKKGHSRVPVYHEEPDNILGLILVKNLLAVKPEDEVPIKNLTIRSIPRVHESIPLVQLLNEFQRGLSHMAVVTRPRNGSVEDAYTRRNREEVRLEMYGVPRKRSFRGSMKVLPPATKSFSRSSKRWSGESHPEILNLSSSSSNNNNNNNNHPNPVLKLPKEEEVVGIITMEDVIEELLKDDIYDEMDHYGSSRTSWRIFSRRIHGIAAPN